MRYIPNALQMKNADQYTIQKLGVPSLVLMEHAALSCVKVMKEKAMDFLSQPSITIVKKTKKSEKEVDIKSMIYKFEVRNDSSVYMLVATGSVENLKPELVMQALCNFLSVDTESVSFAHHRLDVYANVGTEEEKKFVSLDQVQE